MEPKTLALDVFNTDETCWHDSLDLIDQWLILFVKVFFCPPLDNYLIFILISILISVDFLLKVRFTPLEIMPRWIF